MPRPRKPTVVLELEGAFKKNPDRGRARKNEPKPSGPLGDPHSSLSANEKAVWLELATLCPAGVLTNADRWLVEVSCRLMSKVREDGIGGKYGVSVGELAQLNQCLIRMGMTPADRSKIAVAKDTEEANPFTELANESTDRPN